MVTVTFRQRRFGVRTEFEFDDASFGYGIRDIGGGRGERIAYEVLDPDARSSFTVPNSQYLMRWMIPAYMVMVAIWALGPGTVQFPVIATLLVVTVAVFLAGMYELTAVTFTEVATFGADTGGVRGFVRIIRDDQHDAILGELTGRWRAHVKAIAGHVDPAADPDAEAARLGWLHGRGVLSDAEHRWALDQLRPSTREADEAPTTH